MNPHPSFFSCVSSGDMFMALYKYCCRNKIPFSYDPFTHSFRATTILKEDRQNLKDICMRYITPMASR